MRVMRARTGLWEPRGGNALGPPGHGLRRFSHCSASIATTVLSSIRWRSYRGVLHRQQFRELPICGGLSTRGQLPMCRIAVGVLHQRT